MRLFIKMDFKKLLLFIVGIFIIMGVGNSVVVVKNECGGVMTSNTHYILNFSETTESYCFSYGLDATFTNITFEGLYPIDVKSDNFLFFYKGGAKYPISVNDYSYDLNIKNIEFYSSLNKTMKGFVRFDGGQFRSRNYLIGGEWENITFNLRLESYISHSMNTFDSGFVAHGYFQNINHYNIYAPNVDYFQYLWSAVGNQVNLYETGHNYYNSYFNVGQRTNGYFSNYYNYNNNWYDSVFILDDSLPNYIYGEDNFASGRIYNNYYTNSILGGITFLDVNDDGTGETTTETKIINPAIHLELFDLNIFQNLEEGEEIFNTLADNNLKNIYVNDEILSDSHIGTYFTNSNGEINDFENTLIIEKMNNFIISGGIDCSLFGNEFCLIQDSPTYSSIVSDDYRGLLEVGGNTIIEYINLVKIGSNNAQLISNIIDNYEYNLTIRNNNFYKSDDRLDDGNNHLLYLKSNTLNINNNLFEVIYTNSQSYEYIDIKSTTPNNNKVTENIFQHGAVVSPVEQEIFSNNADTTFYNNYIGSDFVISTTEKTNLNINPLISVEYLNQLYYFQIGNYYEDNLGCVDINGDNICDSPYTSGNITDDFPLVSYPYVLLQNLGDALFIVDKGAYNISLINITNGETINLIDGTETLRFSFSHASDYPNLVCDYIIDGASVGQEINPSKDVVYSFEKVGGWTTKTYSHRVECYNVEGGSILSDEITFNIILETSVNICGNTILESGESCDDGNSLDGDGCSSLCLLEQPAVCGNNVWEIGETCDDGNLISGDGCSSLCLSEVIETETDLNLNVFSGDVTETGDGLQSLLNVLQTPMGVLILLGSVFLGISLIGLVFAIARFIL